jgi:hypothetical protein
MRFSFILERKERRTNRKMVERERDIIIRKAGKKV